MLSIRRGDVDQFGWEYHTGTITDGDSLVASNNPLPACIDEPLALTVNKKLPVGTWEVDGFSLELSYTKGPQDQIESKTFGSCNSYPAWTDPESGIFKGKSSKTMALCEVKPWWRWTLIVATGSAAGAGTDADIQVQWKCGTFSATKGMVALVPLCDELACFERCARLHVGFCWHSFIVSAVSYPPCFPQKRQPQVYI